MCEQDQVAINISGIPVFSVCYVLADKLRAVLQGLAASGERIYEVEGDRPGKTCGDTDQKGNRTLFSNHSYGLAIDISPAHNGLYDNCMEFNPQCRLLRGGLWRPEDDPRSILPDGRIVEAMKNIGLHWGGKIRGRQKDFMHFSPDGY